MKTTGVAAYGAGATIYEGGPGDCLPGHVHSMPHGHVVIRGRTRVEIEGREPFEMAAGMPNFELPPDIRHQITVLEQDTIFLNMMEVGAAPDPLPAQSGGVMLDDGTIVYP